MFMMPMPAATSAIELINGPVSRGGGGGGPTELPFRDLALSDVTIRRARERPCAVDTCPEAPGGTGLGAYFDATVRDFLLRENPDAAERYRSWFVQTFNREPPGLRTAG